MKYFIIAGEASGDLHGSKLMASLKQADPYATFAYWGGDQMAAVDGAPLKHIRDLAFMGFIEVVRNLRTILGFIKKCKAQITDFQPDAVILIDYPGFNLRMAKWAKQRGYQVYYFISPQVWAWKSNRVKTIDQYVDRLYGILPFEPAFFEDRGVDIDYFGHPLVGAIDAYLSSHPKKEEVIALLPGSRDQEVKKMLPLMIEGMRRGEVGTAYVSKAPTLPASMYQDIFTSYPDVDLHLHEESSYSLLAKAKAALVTSGTATLETALFGVPEVVCYKGSSISYMIAKRIVDLKYISLVNLICDRLVVKELIQHDCNPSRIREELTAILQPDTRARILEDYQYLRMQLSPPSAEVPTDLVAKDIVKRMRRS